MKKPNAFSLQRSGNRREAAATAGGASSLAAVGVRSRLEKAKKVGATYYDSLFCFSAPETNGKQLQEPVEPRRWQLSGSDSGPEKLRK